MSEREVWSLLRRATAAADAGRPEAGIPFAARAVAAAPEDPRALCTLAFVEYRSRHYDASLRSANLAVAADPESEWAHRLRGLSLWELGRSEAATDALAEAMRADPTEERALSDFAWFASCVGRGEEALAAGRRAVELSPRDASSWFALGWAAWSMKRWESAEEALLRARALRPDDSNMHNNLGALYAKLGRFEEALKCFDRGLELDARSIYAYRNAAFCLRSLGRWDEAASLVERDAKNKLYAAEDLLRQRPSSRAHRSRAFALYHLDRMDEVYEALTTSLELAEGPDEAASPLRELASQELLRGHDSEALRLAERLIREYPRDRLALSEATWVGWLADAPELAARAAARLAAEGLSPATVAAGAAEAALAAHDWAAAEQHLKAALELSRNAADCCLHAALGAAYHHLGLRGESEAELLEAFRGDPRCATLLALQIRQGLEAPVPTDWHA